jgi:hypothetical protein
MIRRGNDVWLGTGVIYSEYWRTAIVVFPYASRVITAFAQSLFRSMSGERSW